MRILYICLISIWTINYTSAQSTQKYAPDQLLVKFKQDVELDTKNLFSSKGFGHEVLIPVRSSYPVAYISKTGNKREARTYLVQFQEYIPIEKAVTAFNESDLFEYVEPNYIGEGGGKSICLPPVFPNDDHFKRQWALYNDGTFNLSSAKVDADIDMELAWDIEQGSEDIVVAILDTGIKGNHPDFSGRMWTNLNENSNGTDSDNNGYADDLNGWDFANNDNLPVDDYGHGTNVAGIVGAKPDNAIGYAGVDWTCKIMNCKILNEDNFGYYSWWTEAIYYAVDNGAHVINMSVGGASFSSIMRDAINYAHDNGVVVVASMMNFNNGENYYPAAYGNTIAVGSTNSDDTRSKPFFWDPTSGSNFGNHIDVVAPGNYIYGLNYISNTNYNTYWGGTSQAAPMVSGLCALLLAQDPTRTPDELRQIIRNTAEDMVGNPTEDTEGFDVYYGHGRINAFRALNQLGVPTNDQISDSALRLYPNPVNHKLKIEGLQKGDEIVICTTAGQEIQQLRPQQHELEVDISLLIKGIYYIKVTNPKTNQMHMKRFIKL